MLKLVYWCGLTGCLPIEYDRFTKIEFLTLCTTLALDNPFCRETYITLKTDANAQGYGRVWLSLV